MIFVSPSFFSMWHQWNSNFMPLQSHITTKCIPVSGHLGIDRHPFSPTVVPSSWLVTLLEVSHFETFIHSPWEEISAASRIADSSMTPTIFLNPELQSSSHHLPQPSVCIFVCHIPISHPSTPSTITISILTMTEPSSILPHPICFHQWSYYPAPPQSSIHPSTYHRYPLRLDW